MHVLTLAWSVCLSVCVLVTLVSPAKTAELIQMHLGEGADSRGPKKPFIRRWYIWVQPDKYD